MRYDSASRATPLKRRSVSRLNDMIRRATALLLVIVAGSCSSTTVDLPEALQLHVTSWPRVATAGDTLEASFTLENRSDRPLHLCSPGGVSMVLEAPGQPRWPLILHGITTDVECSGPITLAPHEATTFVERGVIRRTWPAGSAKLVGTLTVWCREVSRCKELQLETHQMLEVRGAGG